MLLPCGLSASEFGNQKGAGWGQRSSNGVLIDKFHAFVYAEVLSNSIFGCTVAAGWTVKIPGESDHYMNESQTGTNRAYVMVRDNERTINSWSNVACCDEKTCEIQYKALGKDGSGNITGFGFGISLQGSQNTWSANNFFQIVRECAENPCDDPDSSGIEDPIDQDPEEPGPLDEGDIGC